MTAEALPEATALKVTFATLTTPIGLVRLELWSPETIVDPLVNVARFVVGAVENSAVLPPPTDAIVAIAGV